MKRLALDEDAPAVAACCEVDGVEVMFVSAHLFPYPENAQVRKKEVKQILANRRGRALVLMDDLSSPATFKLKWIPAGAASYPLPSSA